MMCTGRVFSKKISPKFLPFEEARKCMHKLNFQRFSEWSKWRVSGQRPSFLPSNPDRVYADSGWVSFPDYMGYQKRETKMVSRSNFLGKSLPKNATTRPRGMSLMKQWLEEADPNFECRFLHGRMTGNLLVRYRESTEIVQGPEGEDVGWIALRVFRGIRKDPTHCLQFVSIYTPSGITMCFLHDKSKKTIFQRHDSSWDRKKAIFLQDSQFDAIGASSCDRVRSLCQDPTLHRTYWDWVLNADAPFVTKRHCASLFILYDRFYRKAGVQFNFSEWAGLVNCSFNSYLDQYRCLHRSTKYYKSRSAHCLSLLRQRRDGSSVYFSTEEEFDLLNVSIYTNGEMNGFFIFPKSVLYPYLDSPEKRGNSALILYPPFVSPRYQTSKEKQRWQVEYYIDLMPGFDVTENIEKFRRILQTPKKIPAKPEGELTPNQTNHVQEDVSKLRKKVAVSSS